MSRAACRIVLDAEGMGLDRVLSALRFRQAELLSFSVRRSGDAFVAELVAGERPGRTMPNLEALFSRIGEVRSVEVQEVEHDEATETA